jgi:hypothetical protein
VELIWSFGICIRWINNIQVIKFILHRFCCLLITNLLSFFLNRGVKSNKLLVKTCCLLEASTIWHDLYYTLKDEQRQTKQNTKQKTKKFSNTVFTKNKCEHMSSRRLNSPCHKYMLAKILLTWCLATTIQSTKLTKEKQDKDEIAIRWNRQKK